MKLHEITGVSETSFKIEKASKGFIIPLISQDATIKMERVNTKQGTELICPEMHVGKLDAFYNTLFPRTEITPFHATNNTYKNIFVPIAFNGVIELHEDDYVKVTLKGLNPANALVVHNADAVNTGLPIRILRQDIKASLYEKSEDLNGTSYLFFDNGEKLFSKIEFQKQTLRGALRTVSISKEQILKFNRENRITMYDEEAQEFVEDTTFKAFPCTDLGKVIVHKDDANELIYYKVSIRP